MGKISRDSFKETHNVLGDLRGLTPVGPSSKSYVSLRLQQGVPFLDADFNEVDDIRRAELELMLAKAIGNGVPAGSDGFKILEATTTNNFVIEAGLLFLDGWWVFNPVRIDYLNQPHRTAKGLAPPLRILQNIPAADQEVAYLDAWELVVDSQEDTNLINPRIGVETCNRIQRGWVVRLEPVVAGMNPTDPTTYPNTQPGHRYYPLSLINRPAGGQISAAMMTDLRRTYLTLEATTFAPLLIDDVARNQRLDSPRLAGAFRGHLDAMRDLLNRSPEIFVFPAKPAETSQSTTALNDVRASAISFEQQARNQLLHKTAATDAMQVFSQTERNLSTFLQTLVAGGIAGPATTDFINIYHKHLDGTVPNDPQSLQFALNANDLLGAVMAQERLNEELGLQNNSLPEGTVAASLISITPSGPLADKTVHPQYQLTIRVQSNLTSSPGSEKIRAIVSAGPGWTLVFQGTSELNQNEIVVTVPNQQSVDVVLNISADVGAADTTLNLSVRPERRQQLVFILTPQTMKLGSELLPGTVLATLTYNGSSPMSAQGVVKAGRAVMATPGGRPIGWRVINLSAATETYKVTVTPLAAATGWMAVNEPILSPLAPGAPPRDFNINFGITDQAGAVSPLTYRLQLTRVTGGANDPLPNTKVDITFELI
jgi:hypothetical protein